MIIVAGVSTLRPLLNVAGVCANVNAATGNVRQISALGIQHTVDVATAAMTGNYIGPLVAAVAFVRFLLFRLVHCY